jgi:hypothetical protein
MRQQKIWDHGIDKFMKNFNEWKDVKNSDGGLDPLTDKQKKIWKKADLITLPAEIKGTNCGNCSFYKDGFCEHKAIKDKVTPRMCCAYWDNLKVVRKF